MADKILTRTKVIKLLHHSREDRGMALIAEASRCVRMGEVHELVSTDQTDLGPGARIDRVGFIGFVEILNAGVLEAGDNVFIEGRTIARLVGFDCCHFPNHYNIIIACDRLMTADNLELSVGDGVTFSP